MMEYLNKLSTYCYRPWLGLLVIRISVGLIFIHHGLIKLQNVDGSVAFMSTLGIPPFLAYCAIFVEVVGGTMIIAGILTRVAAVATGIVALVAFFAAVLPMRGIAGGEFELLLAGVSFGLALVGSGKARLLHIFEHD